MQTILLSCENISIPSTKITLNLILMHEKVTAARKSTKQSHPCCEKHGKLVKMCVVKNLMKPNYGRPFFVCSDQSNLCLFWIWGDVRAIAKPQCRHGFQCVIRKVKKETINKDCLFFCWAQEASCKYFDWVPDESYYELSRPLIKKPNEKHKEQYSTNEFINDLSTAFSQRPVYEFVCISFRTDNLNCLKVS